EGDLVAVALDRGALRRRRARDAVQRARSAGRGVDLNLVRNHAVRGIEGDLEAAAVHGGALSCRGARDALEEGDAARVDGTGRVCDGDRAAGRVVGDLFPAE